MGDDHFIKPDNDTPRRSPNQALANKFDLDLFRLIERAEVLEKNDIKWYGIKMRLVQARLLVRSMMHKGDVEVTE